MVIDRSDCEADLESDREKNRIEDSSSENDLFVLLEKEVLILFPANKEARSSLHLPLFPLPNPIKLRLDLRFYCLKKSKFDEVNLLKLHYTMIAEVQLGKSTINLFLAQIISAS